MNDPSNHGSVAVPGSWDASQDRNGGPEAAATLRPNQEAPEEHANRRPPQGGAVAAAVPSPQYVSLGVAAIADTQEQAPNPTNNASAVALQDSLLHGAPRSISPAAAPSSSSPLYNYYSSSFPPPPGTLLQQQEQDHSGSLALAVVAGSFIGLTAAAAVRWLNGGDFYLFPPATTNTAASSSSTTAARRAAHREQQDDRLDSYPHQAQSSMILSRQEREQDTVLLIEQSLAMENLVSRLQSQVDQHEQLLVQFQETMQEQQQPQPQSQSTEYEALFETTTTTLPVHEQQQQKLDQSMDLPLLRHDDSNTRTVLREIRAALMGLQSPDDHGEFFTVRLQHTLDKLDTTLDGMMKIQQSTISCRTNQPTAVVSSSSSTSSMAPVRQQTSYHQSDNPINDSSSRGNDDADTTSLANALSQLVLDNPDAAQRQAAAQMLYLYVVNLSSHPKVPRYRKICITNETYRHNVQPVQGADALLRAVGFRQRGNAWEWEPPDEGVSVDRLRQAAAALSILKVEPRTSLLLSPEALLRQVLETVGLQQQPQPHQQQPAQQYAAASDATTPPRGNHYYYNSNNNNNNINSDAAGTPDAYTTPVHADILSPPATKKQLTPPLEVDFAALVQPSLLPPAATTDEVNNLVAESTLLSSASSNFGPATPPSIVSISQHREESEEPALETASSSSSSFPARPKKRGGYDDDDAEDDEATTTAAGEAAMWK
jgi:PUB domain